MPKRKYKNDFENLKPFSIKNKKVFFGGSGPIVLIDAAEKVHTQRKLSSLEHSIFILSKSTAWIKVTRGSGLILSSEKFKGSRKVKVPSKKLLIIAKSDLKHLKNKYSPILSYTPSSDMVWSVLFRYEKLDQLHIDTPSAKISGVCRLDGLRYVNSDYAKTRKTVAKINFDWAKKTKAGDLKCVWTKNFAELMVMMGLIFP
jgi:hypothetical protein